jgi:hypothetical protein
LKGHGFSRAAFAANKMIFRRGGRSLQYFLLDAGLKAGST